MKCERCGDRGIVLGEKGYVVCRCQEMKAKREYLKPVKMCIEDQDKAMAEVKKAKPLENRTQAILRSDRNVVSLIMMMSAEWYPGEYRIVALTELNAIEFGRWEEYKSVHDLVRRYKQLIIDARYISKDRDSTMRRNDERVLVEAMKANARDETAKIVILLPSTLKGIKRAYENLLPELNEIGPYYYSKGKIVKFPGEEGDGEGEGEGG